jgi:hypothetical protein
MDYAAGVRGRRFNTDDARGATGPSAERSHFVGVVMEHVGAQAVAMLLRLWDESQPLVWTSISQGCSSSVDIALVKAIFDEALALEETVARVRAQRGSFMLRGRLCDASCTESHYNVACSRCGQDWGDHVGHTCQGIAQVEDSCAFHAPRATRACDALFQIYPPQYACRAYRPPASPCKQHSGFCQYTRLVARPQYRHRVRLLTASC